MAVETPKIPWTALAMSKPFRFTVGPEKHEFTIHSDVVARQSPALERLVKGNFSEAHEGHAVLEFVDDQTFARFAQYAYTKTYDGVHDRELYDYYWNVRNEFRPILRRGNRRLAKEGQLLWADFTRQVRGDMYTPPSETWDSDAPEKDFTAALLCHARLYVFADYYGIADLMALTFERLGQALMGFHCHLNDGKGAGDVVALLRYCFETPAPEKLKAFVVLYAACKAEILWKSEDFQELVAGNRELSMAFIGQVMH